MPSAHQSSQNSYHMVGHCTPGLLLIPVMETHVLEHIVREVLSVNVQSSSIENSS
jgi:hypothetical protein